MAYPGKIIFNNIYPYRLDKDLVILNDPPIPTSIKLVSIHEIGHVLGIHGHIDKPTSFMQEQLKPWDGYWNHPTGLKECIIEKNRLKKIYL